MKRRRSQPELIIVLSCAALIGCGDDASTPSVDDGAVVSRDAGASSARDAGVASASDAGSPAPGSDAGVVVVTDGGAAPPTPDAGTPRDAGPLTTGRVFLESHYEAESEGGAYADEVGEVRYVPGGGFRGSNCWEVHLFGDRGNEDHAGWTTVSVAEGTTQTLFVGHMLYVSAGMVDKLVNHNVGGKMLDAHMHPWDRYARQTVIWAFRSGDDAGFVYSGVDGVQPALVNGGAGGGYVEQRRPTEFDLRDYADQWIWLELELNATERYTRLWVKTADGVFSGRIDEPLMHRSADDPADWTSMYGVEGTYVYYPGGWEGPGMLWGYWDDLEGVPFTDADFVRLDDLIVSDAWIEPPF